MVNEPSSGTLSSVTDAKGITTSYTYNSIDQLQKVEKDGKQVEYSYNKQNLLSKIKQGTKEYNFEYDEFLNTAKISIGSTPLVTNQYEEHNGNLKTSTYGNLDTIHYEYDDFGRIKKMIKTDDYYVYHYNNVGNVAKIESIKDLYQYYYDSASRLTGYQFNDYSMNYRYGTTGNILDKYYELDEAHHLHYDYNADNAVTKITFCNDNDSSAMTRAVGGGYNMPYTGEVNYIYDALGRMKEQNINDVYKTNYYYVTKGYRTSFLLDKMKNGEEELCYNPSFVVSKLKNHCFTQ